MTKQSTGQVGEKLAKNFLKKKGYTIVESNFRTRFGEIDIVAKEGDLLVFVEVKARRSVLHGLPEEAVNFRKQNKIVHAALEYIHQKDLGDISWRIDVVSILMPHDQEPKIKLIRNAVER